ncbi:alpha/beta fold hydrolase [Undibacterium sp. TJN25]|uniref:alpha/beta fold hydrolase n=1 Tax=Undibacterium sp. TJN25 TaxID=3413056 RepID=UPI003BF183C6
MNAKPPRVSFFRQPGRVIATVLLTVLLVLSAMLAFASIYSMAYQSEDRLQAKPEGGSYVPAGDTRIFVQSMGARDAPAVVFIHGTGAWSEIWRSSMKLAAQQGYHAVAIDLPPFGYSVPPASGKYDKGAQAQRILAALDSMGIQKAVFVSHSIGSAPLMEALLREPQRVDKLILVCAALGLDSPQTDGADTGLQSALRRQWLAQPLSAALLTNPAFTSTLMKSFVSEKEKVTPAWVETYQKPLSLSGTYQAVALWLPELLAARGTWRSDRLESYLAIRFPVQLIWGQEDTITPLAQAEHLRTLIPGAQLSVIPRSGHVPMVEEPEAFQKVLGFSLGERR